jgi:hypothetical protein
MDVRKCQLIGWLTLLAGGFFASAAQAQVTNIVASDTQSYFGSLNDTYQASNPTGLNPWPAAGPNPPIFYSTINQLPGVPSPPGGNVAPTNASPFWPFNGTSFYNDGNGNTASSAISAFISGNTGTADDAQIGLFMTLTQTTGGYAYEQINYDVDFNVSSVVNTTGTAGTLPGLVTRSYTVSGSVGGSAGFVAFGGQMNFWDGTTNASLGPPLLFNYFNNLPGAFTATVNGSSFINAVNFPDVLRITGDFFLIGDPSTITVNSVPEPSTIALSVTAAVCLLAFGRRRKFTGRR